MLRTPYLLYKDKVIARHCNTCMGVPVNTSEYHIVESFGGVLIWWIDKFKFGLVDLN